MPLCNLFSRRDAILVLVGASCMHIFSSLFYDAYTRSTVINILPDLNPAPARQPDDYFTSMMPITFTSTAADLSPSSPSTPFDIAITPNLPETSIVAHAPGWTIFRNLYMSSGTLFILSSINQPSTPYDPSSNSSFPGIRFMTSTGLPALNTPENIASREPTKENMDFISPQEAKRRWGGDVQHGGRNRVWSVEGNTLLYNDPPQFLDHYYHFAAELLFGTWAFWLGAFGTPTSSSYSNPGPIARAIFIHADTEGWRDAPGFNAYFLRATFPSLTVEVAGDWADRVAVTIPPSFANSQSGIANARGRVWHFPVVLLADRSAAHRGDACGSRTQRTAAEAWEYMVSRGKLDLVGGWWGAVRRRVLGFAGVAENGLGVEVEVKDHGEEMQADDEWEEKNNQKVPQIVNAPASLSEIEATQKNATSFLPAPDKIVITYITRQSTRRRLIEEDHEGLVVALEELVARKGGAWELNVMQAERLTKDEQVRVAGKTTILLGVHGNGLTHLVLMKPTRLSAVIEIFYPGGFARDYEWTTRALGMRHFSVWNDTHFTHPNEPEVAYPEGFQGMAIPIYGPAVSQLIEDRVEGKL